MESMGSKLEGSVVRYKDLYEAWHGIAGQLGGNWDYDHGSWDVPVDEEQFHWLRIPFRVVHGRFDGEKTDNDAMIEIRNVYVLHHEPRREPVPGVSPLLQPIPAIFAQFQPPAVEDGPVREQPAERARAILAQLESAFPAAVTP